MPATSRDSAERFVVHAGDRGAEQGPFAHPLNPRSEVYGLLLSRKVGLSRAAVNLARLAPGKESFIFHVHHVEEEWLYVLEGAATLEIGEERFEVGPGDFAGFPPGTYGHHLVNGGAGDLLYLSGGESREAEIGDFPRAGLRLVRLPHEATLYPFSAGKALAPMPPPPVPERAPRDLLLRGAELESTAEALPRHPSIDPGAERRQHRLAARAGLSRTALNLVRVAPGKRAGPLHKHAAEEEWVYVLRGRARGRIGDEEVDLGPGDFAGFPTGAPARMLANRAAEELVYLCGGEVALLDVVSLPALGKRLVRVGEERSVYPEETPGR